MTGGDCWLRMRFGSTIVTFCQRCKKWIKVTEKKMKIRVPLGCFKELKAVSVRTLPYPGFNRYAGSVYCLDVRESNRLETFSHRGVGLHSDISPRIPLSLGVVTACKNKWCRQIFGLVRLWFWWAWLKGETKVNKLVHLDRGYYKFHEKLAAQTRKEEEMMSEKIGNI